jgi:UDP-2-acetamido-2,6-beta-L-arabino-hexul-4-ose reductase
MLGAMKILISGAGGFVGRNLAAALRERQLSESALERVCLIDVGNSADELNAALADTDVIFHLAGVNRPKDEAEFFTTNAGLTEAMCERLVATGRAPMVIFASSIQAQSANAYGRSKLLAEQALESYAARTGATVVVHRLKNLFGKWCRPNYNAVTATFCHNIARDLPIEISDPARLVSLTYVDDVVDVFLGDLSSSPRTGFRHAAALSSTEISLGDLAALIRSFKAQRTSLLLPDFSARFVRALYATYLSYIEPENLAYALMTRSDPRGSLAEFVKQSSFGQLFVSRTKPGITRGNHHHATKTEKFLVVEGRAIVRLRQIEGTEVLSFAVRGEEFRVIDIPPGYTHSIENVGAGELVTLFWASELFDPAHPDTVQNSVFPQRAL